jgi:hypothetical protein
MKFHQSNSPKQLIAIVGMPRSGTTWVGKIFDSHPATIYRHEPDSGGRLSEIPYAPNVENANHYTATINDFVASLLNARSARVAGKTPVFPKIYYTPMQHMLKRGSVAASGIGARLFGEFRVQEFINFSALTQSPVVWKSIESVTRLGVLARALPNATFIHLVRHPCGFVASNLRGKTLKPSDFAGRKDGAEDFSMLQLLFNTEVGRASGATLNDLYNMSPVERQAWRWYVSTEKALKDTEGLTNCLTILYEDVCRNPMEMTRRMFAFANLSWNAQTEEFIDASTSREKSAYYSVFKNPLQSANRWRQQLPNSTIDRIVAVVGQTGAGNLYSNAS